MTQLQRKELAHEALNAALEVRRQTSRSLLDPVCIYDVAAEMHVDVWLRDIPSLEGMYSKSPGPAIILGSERPSSRRAYTCGHELGHHVFGHGTRVDELCSHGNPPPGREAPEEFLAQSFAGFLLMPKLAVQNAFRVRGWNPTEATKEQVYRVANLFGVGYRTLVGHLHFGLGILAEARAQALAKLKVMDIRADLIADDCPRPLIVVDTAWIGRAVDLEIGELLLAPEGTLCDGSVLRCAHFAGAGTLWEPAAPGVGRLLHPDSGWAVHVRVSRSGFTGRACFRHIPEVSDDHEQ